MDLPDVGKLRALLATCRKAGVRRLRVEPSGAVDLEFETIYAGLVPEVPSAPSRGPAKVLPLNGGKTLGELLVDGINAAGAPVDPDAPPAEDPIEVIRREIGRETAAAGAHEDPLEVIARGGRLIDPTHPDPTQQQTT